MVDHLQSFLNSFIDKRHRKGWSETSTRTKRGDNPILGMDALYRELDWRYCFQLPKGSKQQDIAFVKAALTKYKYKPSTCFVLSAYDRWNEQNAS